MSQKSQILIVDDTPDSRMLLKTLLEQDYAVAEADSGEACLAHIEQQCPDLILLDINMPGLNGYEVCKHLRKQQATKYLPIIFVSVLDTVEERLAGFEVGADDYVIKPVDGENLIGKVQECLLKQQGMAAAQAEAANAMELAMEAMTVSSELGQIIQFVKDVSKFSKVEELGQPILNIAEEFGLSVALMVKTDGIHYIGCDTESLESKLLLRFTKHTERILSVGIHTIIRNDHIVMLVKNMPLEDENLYGRLKDHLAMLMDIVNAHVKAIEAQLALGKQRKLLLKEVISVAEKQIKIANQRLFEHDQNSQAIMQGMVLELEEMLFGMGLDEDQEQQLIKLADQTSLKLEQAKGSTQALSAELGTILESLYDFLETPV